MSVTRLTLYDKDSCECFFCVHHHLINVIVSVETVIKANNIVECKKTPPVVNCNYSV